MKKIISLSIAIILFVSIFTGCSTNNVQTTETTRQTIEITAENFLDYFNVNFSSSDYRFVRDDNYYFSGLDHEYCTIKISITPKQAIQSGNVYIDMRCFFDNWDTEGNCNIPPNRFTFDFNPAQTFEYEIAAEGGHTEGPPPTDMYIEKIFQARGTITL